MVSKLLASQLGLNFNSKLQLVFPEIRGIPLYNNNIIEDNDIVLIVHIICLTEYA